LAGLTAINLGYRYIELSLKKDKSISLNGNNLNLLSVPNQAHQIWDYQ
jgi:hypothetical protein